VLAGTPIISMINRLINIDALGFNVGCGYRLRR
jgi:hypothetical protein